MRGIQSLRWRIRLAMLGLCVAGAIAGILVVGGPSASWTLGRTAQVFEAVPDTEFAACDADPAGWSYRTERGLQAWAMDPETDTLLHPDAPEIPPNIAFRLAAGESTPAAIAPQLSLAAMVVRRDAPCAAVLVLWPSDTGIAVRVLSTVFALVAIFVVFAALLVGWAVLRPVLTSVRALDDASRRIGRDSYTSPEVNPEMEAVRQALDAAHDRVLADRQQLEDERARLERHIADVSHDLRSPLAALQLRLERIAHAPDDLEAVRGALADVAYLDMLTDNLATVRQLETGLRTDDSAHTDVGAIAVRVARRFAVLGRQSGIEVVSVVPDEPVEVPAPTLYVEQILANLVHNAVRHHDGSGTVAVVVEPDGDGARIEVVDDGPGRVAALPTARAEPGATHGLGLSIARQLAEALGGTLEFEDVAPRGLSAHLALRRS